MRDWEVPTLLSEFKCACQQSQESPGASGGRVCKIGDNDGASCTEKHKGPPSKCADAPDTFATWMLKSFLPRHLAPWNNSPEEHHFLDVCPAISHPCECRLIKKKELESCDKDSKSSCSGTQAVSTTSKNDKNLHNTIG